MPSSLSPGTLLRTLSRKPLPAFCHRPMDRDQHISEGRIEASCLIGITCPRIPIPTLRIAEPQLPIHILVHLGRLQAAVASPHPSGIADGTSPTRCRPTAGNLPNPARSAQSLHGPTLTREDPDGSCRTPNLALPFRDGTVGKQCAACDLKAPPSFRIHLEFAPKAIPAGWGKRLIRQGPRARERWERPAWIQRRIASQATPPTMGRGRASRYGWEPEKL